VDSCPPSLGAVTRESIYLPRRVPGLKEFHPQKDSPNEEVKTHKDNKSGATI